MDLKTIFGGSVLNRLVSSETGVPNFDTLHKKSLTLTLFVENTNFATHGFGLLQDFVMMKLKLGHMLVKSIVSFARLKDNWKHLENVYYQVITFRNNNV